MDTPTNRRPTAAGHRHRSVAALAALVGGAVVTLLPLAPAEAATPAIQLRTSGSFAVLAGSGITNTGATTITGDVGTHPTPSETGFDTVTLDGVDHVDDAVTQQAKDDLTTAYGEAAASGPPNAVATELGGLTLTPGVYSSDTLGITGTLTLDTLGDPHAVFVFQAATTLITATDSAVVVLGGGEACNVFWQVGSSATLGTRGHLVGSVLAATSITATTGATVRGRLLAGTGAVTLDHNTITRDACTGTSATPTTATGGTTGGTDVPAGTGGPTAEAGPGPTSPTVPDDAGVVPPTTTSGTPSTSTTPTTVTGAAGPPRLPYTGSATGRLAVVGIALVAAGIGATHRARRRPTPLAR